MELNEQTLEQILTRQEEKFERALTREREQFQNYMGVQVEDLRSEIQLVAEIVFGIQEQLLALRDLVAKNTADIEMMKLDIMAMKADFAGMKAEMEGVRLEMEMMRSELSIIRSDLKVKVGRDEFAVLEARVAMLERSGRARP